MYKDGTLFLALPCPLSSECLVSCELIWQQLGLEYRTSPIHSSNLPDYVVTKPPKVF